MPTYLSPLEEIKQRPAPPQTEKGTAEHSPLSRDAIDLALARIDEVLNRQLDIILHHPCFQALEAAWRSLQFLVERTDIRENTQIMLLSVSKDDLYADFSEAPEIFLSGLYHHVHRMEYGQFGGRPYGAIIGNYEFGPDAGDVALLRYIAGVAATAHAPFIAAANSDFFGIQNFEELPRVIDLRSVFAGSRYVIWRGFRESQDARYIGLTIPRFLLRTPYRPDNSSVGIFDYKETTNSCRDYLWGNAAFAFATRLIDSFAEYRWCPNIIGIQGGGVVKDLPVACFQSTSIAVAAKISTEVLITETSEYELAEEGFIPLTCTHDYGVACFFSGNSVRKIPEHFPDTPEGQAHEISEQLGAQLPYLLIICRIAHYIKVLQREALGMDKEKQQIRDELMHWLGQYVTQDDTPQPGIRAQRPLRWAELNIDDVMGRPGWYSVHIKIRPHFKFLGASFTLSLVGQQGPPNKQA